MDPRAAETRVRESFCRNPFLYWCAAPHRSRRDWPAGEGRRERCSCPARSGLPEAPRFAPSDSASGPAPQLDPASVGQRREHLRTELCQRVVARAKQPARATSLIETRRKRYADPCCFFYGFLLATLLSP